MTVNLNPIAHESDLAPRLQIKCAARRLIAERGVRNVSVREIAQAANQRNLGVVAYYFGTKDKLVTEILIDGAERIEALRKAHLARLEADGGPLHVADAVAAIILPCARFSDADKVYGECFNRFLLQVSQGYGRIVDQTLEGGWNEAYQRCLSHLRRLTPELTRPEQNRRFVFLGAYVSTVLAQREAMIADEGRDHPTWRAEETLDDFVATASAILTAPRPPSGQR